MGSSRLPGKVLAPIAGRPMLQFMLERLATLNLAHLVVATSVEARDDPVADVAATAGASVVRGSEHDVLDRFRAALAAYPAATVVRLTGDCPLIDPSVVAAAIALHHERDVDYTSNVLPRTFPKGLDVEVVRSDALLTAASEAVDPPEREHVTPFIYRRPERFRLANLWCPEDLGDERWTVDTVDDLEVLRNMVHTAGPTLLGWREVLGAVGRRHHSAPGELYLRPARCGDEALLLRWRNDPDAVRFSGSRAPVDRGEHASWLAARLTDPATRIWIGMIDGRPVGFVRVDVRNGVGDISIAVDRTERGHGLGRRLVARLLEVLYPDFQVHSFRAVVDAHNLASIRIFEDLGFRRHAPSGAFVEFVLGKENL